LSLADVDLQQAFGVQMRQFELVFGAEGSGVNEGAGEAAGTTWVGVLASLAKRALVWVVLSKHQAIRPQEIEGLSHHAV
jgi:hypothetical protein